MKKSDMLAELLAFMQTQDHSWREEWYVSDREMVAKVIERFSAEHLGMPLNLDSGPIQKVEPKVDRKEIMQSLVPHVTEMLKGKP
jgi:hypothetical protein